MAANMKNVAESNIPSHNADNIQVPSNKMKMNSDMRRKFNVNIHGILFEMWEEVILESTGSIPVEHEIEGVTSDPRAWPVGKSHQASCRSFNIDREYLSFGGIHRVKAKESYHFPERKWKRNVQVTFAWKLRDLYLRHYNPW